VKVHTAFKGKIESGLHKILAVGLGNHRGARLVHSLGVNGLGDYKDLGMPLKNWVKQNRW